jgi:hypothetical protein
MRTTRFSERLRTPLFVLAELTVRPFHNIMRTKNPKDSMRLVGFDQTGKVVHEQLMSLYDYYEELHPVIDENVFRKERGIMRLVGTKFDDAGEVEEEWENFYTEAGAISSSIERDRHGKIVREERM